MKTLLLSLAGLLIPFSPAFAQFPPLPAADLVLGAADFDTAGSALATATGMEYPSGIAIDPTSGAVFVSDGEHHRVLRFPDMNSLTNGAPAEAAFGQPDLNQSGFGLSATSLNGPAGVHVDAAGRLWVADSANWRILMYENASTLPSGSAADLVLGQPDFETLNGGNSASQMNSPQLAFVDLNDNLWVVDRENNRVLKFVGASTLANGASATVVLGQVDFGFSVQDLSASAMENPSSLTVDASDNLWVADPGNRRVLRFSDASLLASGASADGVLGQTDFVSDNSGSGAQTFGIPTSVLVDPAGTLWVSDTSNHRVLSFTTARLKPIGAPADGVIGQMDFITNTPGLSARKMDRPVASAVDAAGRLWVCDGENHRVLRFTPDRTAPVLSLKKVPRTTSKAKLKIQGTAGDASGIASVRYRVGKSAYRSARGTSSWNFKAKLKPGLNKIEIQATDATGNRSASKRVKVRRG